MSETKNEEERFWEFYKETAPVVLGKLHNYLFKRISGFLKTLKDKRNLLVIGPGPYFLPFSEFPEEVSKILGERGRLVLMDYNPDIIIKAMENLRRSSFFEKSGLKDNSFREVKIPDSLEARTVTFCRGDLREQLPFDDNSFDCIDMTLAAHHVTATLDDLDRVTSEVYRIMKPSSMLHYGEGFINIDTEKKIIDLAITIRDFFGFPILFTDERDPGHKKYYIFEYGENQREYKRLQTTTKKPLSEKFVSSSLDDLVLDSEGKLTIMTHSEDHAESLRRFLRKTNPKAIIYREGNRIFMPLIDANSEKDQNELINAIDSFYGAIENQVKRNFKKEPYILQSMKLVLDKERETAKRGIGEFFKSYSSIKESLLKAGFKKVEKTKEHPKSPFISIIAFK